MTPSALRQTPDRTPLKLALIFAVIAFSIDSMLPALPQIAAEMDLTPVALSWVQNAYTLVFGGLLLLGARAGDILGRRRVFIVGLAVFGIASFMVGAAQSETWIIASPVPQQPLGVQSESS